MKGPFSRSWLQASPLSFWSPVMKPESDDFSYRAPKDTLGNPAWKNADQAVLEVMRPVSVKKTKPLKSTTKHPASRRQQSCCGCGCCLQFGGVGGSSPTLPHLLPHLPDGFSFLPLPRTDWQTFGNRHRNASDWWKFIALHFLIAFDNRERRTCIYEYAVICRTERLHWQLLRLWTGADHYPTYKDL